MQKSIDKIYYAAIYLRLSKEDGDLSSGEKKESNYRPTGSNWCHQISSNSPNCSPPAPPSATASGTGTGPSKS